MLFYTVVPGATQTTNATPNTTNDCLFVAVGTRSCWVNAIYPQGYMATQTSISGIVYRLVRWTSTASSGGSAVTPSPNDPGFQASKCTAGYSVSAVTPGTGGPTLCLSIGSGITSPGPWTAIDAQGSNSQGYNLQGGTTTSLDLLNVSAAASQNFQVSVGVAE